MLAIAIAIGASVPLACSVYDTSLLGSGASLNGASGDDSRNSGGVGGAASPSDAGAAALGGNPPNYGSSGEQGVSGNSFAGMPQESGGMPSTGGDAAAGETNGGFGGGFSGNGGLGGNGGSVNKAGSGGLDGSGGNPDTTVRELAKGKSVTVSTQQAANAAAQGNDGDTTTRWAANGPSFPQWWRVDLGANHQLVQVSIRFEHPERAYYYSIETSTDDALYTQRIIANGTGVTQDLTLPANVTARYVRITVTNGSPLVLNGIGTWASLWECFVSGY
jgi:hypothetical protein